ncbi:hypothetical protein P4B09_13040 [Lactiplantibacillus plantarum]
MDFIIAIGGLITGIGLIINVFNTRIKYGWFTHYQSKSRPLNYVSLLLIIIGFNYYYWQSLSKRTTKLT